VPSAKNVTAVSYLITVYDTAVTLSRINSE
jgi:hypothetical protein